jgi:TonB family protein
MITVVNKLSSTRPLQLFCFLMVIFSAINYMVVPTAHAASRNVTCLADTLPNDTTVYLKADKQPAYPEGSAALITFLEKNIRYPQLMLEREIEGKVTVQFIVEKDGRLTHIKALKGPGRGSLEEAVRVVKKLPRWVPGYNQAGQAIRVQYQLPVIFALKDSDRNKSNNSLKVTIQ